MTSVINFLKEHEKICFGISVTALIGYLFVRNRKKEVKNNLLN